MQNLFICKFSALKIQFFPSVSVLPSSRTPLSSHPPRHPASFLVGTCLLDLGGTRALVRAWYGEGLADETGCARHSVRGSPGSPNGMRSAGSSVRECGLSRTIIIFGDCAGGSLLSNLYPEKSVATQTVVAGHFEARAHQTGAEPFETRTHQTGAEPLLERERRLRAQDTLRRALTAQPSGGQRGKYY